MSANIINQAFPTSQDFGLAPCIAQHSRLLTVRKIPRNSNATFDVHLSMGINATQLLICKGQACLLAHTCAYQKNEAECTNKNAKLIGTFKPEQLEGQEAAGGMHFDT